MNVINLCTHKKRHVVNTVCPSLYFIMCSSLSHRIRESDLSSGTELFVIGLSQHIAFPGMYYQSTVGLVEPPPSKRESLYIPCVWKRFFLGLEAYSPTCHWQLDCYQEGKKFYNKPTVENNEEIPGALRPLKTSLSCLFYLLSTRYMRS